MRRQALLSLALWTAACAPSGPEPTRVRMTVPRGAGVTTVAETLAARQLIDDRTLFMFYVRATGRSRAIQAGTYEIEPRQTYLELLEVLTTGQAAAYERLVVPEGLMLQEVAAAVQTQLGIPADSFLAAARDSGLRTRLAVPAATLEGYLYPSTYHVRAAASAEDVVRQMIREFENRWRPEWTARLDTLGLTRHELVTLASIIEGEVRHSADRKYVASVYHNRLAQGMRLQADPTVIYALGRRRRLFERDYQRPSPYNTYRVDGLPPGPIAQPSAASIEAALYPVKTDYLFLVARPDGQHVFSRTLREHLAAVREVRGGSR